MVAGANFTLRGKEGPRRFVFLPVGHTFLGENRCSTVPLAEFVTSYQRKIEPLGGAFILEVTVIIGSVCSRCL
jgi:hypothetical protein